MKNNKSFILLIFSLLSGFFVNAQQGVIESEERKIETLQESNIGLKEELTKEKKETEEILTPEQQGFTKFILPSGEVVYRKEESGIMIEYRPKTNL